MSQEGTVGPPVVPEPVTAMRRVQCGLRLGLPCDPPMHSPWPGAAPPELWSQDQRSANSDFRAQKRGSLDILLSAGRG